MSGVLDIDPQKVIIQFVCPICWETEKDGDVSYTFEEYYDIGCIPRCSICHSEMSLDRLYMVLSDD